MSGIEISQEQKVATGSGCELIMQMPPWLTFCSLPWNSREAAYDALTGGMLLAHTSSA